MAQLGDVCESDAGDTPLRSGDGNGVKGRERELTAELVEQIARHQEKLYALRQQKVLLVLQGMDTSGKDGTVRALFSGINPMGLRAVTFKAPNPDELAHDYLWRVHRLALLLQVFGHVAGGALGLGRQSHHGDGVTVAQNFSDGSHGGLV